MTTEWVWIDSASKLKKAQSNIKRASVVGVDTEYDSFRYFREKLCLIQLINGSTTFLFDPLETLDITFLGNVFSDPTTLKIMHAADNDIRILNRNYGFVFKNIFDTHRAASLLGCKYLSLSNVVHQYLGVEFNKSKKVQRSQWDVRPLTEEQLQYAVRDTSYLVDLYRVLDAELKRENLAEKAREVFESLERIRWSEKVLNPGGYIKIKGADELEEGQQRRLRVLYLWRFEKARETNKARFMILSDQELVELACAPIDELSSLAATAILSPRRIDEYGPDIVRVLREVAEK